LDIFTGRAGRTGPGVCFRLYSEEEFSKMEDFTLPEIKRVSLDTLILQILDMNMQSFFLSFCGRRNNFFVYF